ncbi:hypothetical protein [Methylobacterium radiotolerans]|uniref:hypothetical protein n=1 Tax=Methylobacterium radiotolerans TaxID=31998 RepID=UPI001F3F3B44|nr:hypothetical protein [Methylobacterium radiotolerans]UIY43547.1 hypothetical protein LZ599_07575 [Methylobacterium radiotolerans]
MDRRHRNIPLGQRQILEVVGQKVLHGFLQNRHQTLMPLSVNLARLAGTERTSLARFAAVVARSSGPMVVLNPIRAWLTASGADQDVLATFDDALNTPPPLDRALAGLTELETSLIAFILCLIAAREAGPSGWAFADYVALHRGLPTTAVRAAERRYRV